MKIELEREKENSTMYQRLRTAIYFKKLVEKALKEI